jgi:hypothetical protein
MAAANAMGNLMGNLVNGAFMTTRWIETSSAAKLNS